MDLVSLAEKITLLVTAYAFEVLGARGRVGTRTSGYIRSAAGISAPGNAGAVETFAWQPFTFNLN